ncbi:MAG TPA: hypothetical protein VLD65_11080 [Anaerolineales bacterium]|nr:hypothetical protein [Anaerolineales bacterium]
MQRTRKNFSQFFFPPTLTWIWLVLTLLAIGLLTAFGPAEQSLGTHIRIVYLHGAWVWAALAAFMVAGALGGLGLITQRINFHNWSKAFGRTGLFFWITYLPLSLYAMQSNWNGLFLAEPRWRLAMVFSIAGILLQAGLTLAGNPRLTSGFNLGYLIALLLALGQTPNVMHPASPIISSDAWRIQFYFFGLLLLTLLAAWQMARWWYQSESNRIQP